MAQKTILVIEDEPDIQELLQYNLEREGFAVLLAGDGERGLELAQTHSPDLILLDIMLPGLDGIEVCRQLRADPATQQIALIMLTAKAEESDVILGLSLGADDYVSKPFSPRELIARIRSRLRQSSQPSVRGQRIHHGPLVLDAERHELRANGSLIDLTATEFRLLHVLLSSPGRVFTRDQLLDMVIGDRAIVIDRNIDVHVRSIRKKLGEQRSLIETIRGVGYRLADL